MAIDKLNRRLEQPIETYVVIDGPDGLHRQYSRYRRLIGES